MNDKEVKEQETAAWTLLLTGKDHGLVGKAGEKFVGAPKYYERVDVYTSLPAQRKPLTDEEFLELILRTGTQELVGVTTFVGGSIQMHGKMGLLRSAKIIKEFVEAAHGIKENT